MRATRDFHWTMADQEAGFPQLKAAIAATEDAVLLGTYLCQLRDCLTGMFAGNMRVLQRELGKEILSRGITAIQTLFGPIQITDQW